MRNPGTPDPKRKRRGTPRGSCNEETDLERLFIAQIQKLFVFSCYRICFDYVDFGGEINACCPSLWRNL